VFFKSLIWGFTFLKSGNRNHESCVQNGL